MIIGKTNLIEELSFKEKKLSFFYIKSEGLSVLIVLIDENYPKLGIDKEVLTSEFGIMDAHEKLEKTMNAIDKKHISRVLVELAEEYLRCPENRQYVSMSGVIKVKSKVQTQW